MIKRVKMIKSYPTSEHISEKRLAIIKPFIELYLEFLQEKYSKELEISISLSSKTVFVYNFIINIRIYECLINGTPWQEK